MKKLTGYIISWSLFWLGDLISKPVFRFDGYGWLYPVYNGLMNASREVQHWAGNETPWQKVGES